MSAGDELAPPPELVYRHVVEAALREDLGRAGDLTTDAVVPVNLRAAGRLVARQAGRVAGLEAAHLAFRLLDPECRFTARIGDGRDVEAGGVLAEVAGAGRALLAAERTALNFLGRLCGVATATREMVRVVDGTGVRVVCTRKTTPGLRALEKHAVRAGGGANHRFGLDDAVLIKDNHRLLAGGVTAAVGRARTRVGHLVRIEVEVDSLAELEEALGLGIDAVLLDNFSLEDLRRAVELAAGRVVTEASGGITPETARRVAETGVDLLSVGWLTHSAPALDVNFEVEPAS